MGPFDRQIEHEIFHARAGEFFAGLAGEHHEGNPLQLVDIEFGGIERQQALDDDFALLRREDAGSLELEQVAAAI